ncbi:GreA/GreB family elongation factor [Sphingosinicella sp. YJ22]|uniref:GreA/GreB family elongation factor n=1 Tax=Sphingosinicella sp. YJ22 TaxID=1104780 RepID=UPI00140A8644|nr:GreA/GreB family elongation factor [Sphingosinicella sp. YJ22]
MSVAFRRESDEEHLEPKFELPIPPGPNFVTPRGLALIRARLGELETAASTEADDEARKVIERDVRYWRTRLATAEPAPPPAAGEAGIGSQVTFRLAGKERHVAITGHDEADPDAGLIAFSAPLARALMGAAAGDFADFNGREEAIEIISVEPDERVGTTA